MVSAPKNVPLNAIHEFVNSRKSWIHEKLTIKEQREEQFADLARQYRWRMLLRGEWKPVEELIFENKSQIRISEKEQIVEVKRGGRISREELNGAVTGFYKQLARIEMHNRLIELTEKMPITFTRVSIRDQKTRWGSCSSKGSINLNWRMMKLPPEISDYILIHELCHRIHMNHSPKFWKLVRSWYPKVDEATRWIKQNEAWLFADIGYGSLLSER